jgi:hypothetical protein
MVSTNITLIDHLVQPANPSVILKSFFEGIWRGKKKIGRNIGLNCVGQINEDQTDPISKTIFRRNLARELKNGPFVGLNHVGQINEDQTDPISKTIF